MKLRSKITLAPFFVATLAACSVEAPPSKPAAPIDDFRGSSVSATIGAEGGTLEGEPGTALEGFRLVIPAGALDQPTAITARTTFDPTALPVLAEAVGAHVAIEPSGLSLAKSASLTLRTAPSAIDRFLEAATDCKVWLRDGDGWTLAEPADTSDGSVTVSLDTLTTAAPGVKLASSKVNDPGVKTVQCTDPNHTGFCVQPVVFFGPTVTGNEFGVSGDSIYYLTNGPSPKGIGVSVTAVRVDINTGEVAQTLPGIVPIGVSGRIDVDASGNVWVAEGFDGLLELRFGAAAIRYDFGVPEQQVMGASLGAVRQSDGAMARIGARGRFGSVGGKYGAFIPWDNGNVISSGFDGLASANDLVFSVGNTLASEPLSNVPNLPQASGLKNIGLNCAQIAADSAKTACLTSSADLWMGDFGPPQLTRVDLAISISRLAFQADHRLWAADRFSPELVIYDPSSQGASFTALTPAPFGLPAFDAARPLAIHPVTSGLVALTANHRFALVK